MDSSNFVYLQIDLIVISIPLVVGLHPKLKFWRKFPNFLKAFLVFGIVFLIWDVFKTQSGVWKFSEQFTLGIKIINLPLEEVFFFISIPLASLFIYHSIEVFSKMQIYKGIASRITLKPIFREAVGRKTLLKIFLGIAIAAFILAGWVFRDLTYTAVVLWANAAIILLISFSNISIWKSKKFWLFILASYLPFLIVNGVLTGLPVVIYNNAENLGIRVGTIPIEDFFYSFAMLSSYFFVYVFGEKPERK